MSKRFTTSGDAISVPLSPEAIDALGVNTGDELDIEIVGRALVIRSASEAQRSRSFTDLFESILQKRREAYDRLSEGPR